MIIIQEFVEVERHFDGSTTSTCCNCLSSTNPNTKQHAVLS